MPSSPASAARGLATWLASTLLLALLLTPLLPPGVVGGSAALGIAALVVGGWQSGRDGVAPGNRLAAVGAGGGARAAHEGAGGFAFGVGLAAVVLALVALAGGLVWTATPVDPGGWVAEGARSLAWLAVPAATEEVLVRGYPLRALAGAVGPVAAVWATSVGFALLHLNNPALGLWGLGSLLSAGLVLGALVVRTGGLWSAVGAHLGWNWALAFLADVPVSGLEVADAPGLEAWATGPAWLSGGAFGVEGSAVAALTLAGAAVLVFRTPRLHRTNPMGPGVVARPDHETMNPMEDDR